MSKKYRLLIFLVVVVIGATAYSQKTNRKDVKNDVECRTCFAMVTIPAGSFEMGFLETERSQPIHTVTLDSFELGQSEVTWREWVFIMGEDISASLGIRHCGLDCPADGISWNAAQEFIKKLNYKTAGRDYRLPSEAEWEYACRAGGTFEYCGSDDPNLIAWHGGNSGKTAHPVKGKQPNAFGIYDMTGNASEWVQDCPHSSYQGAPIDGSAWEDENCKERVFRGTSWYGATPMQMNAGFRSHNLAKEKNGPFGFRLARSL